METKEANLIVPDTNVLIGDRGSIKKLSNGENLVVIPLTVLVELDKLKNDSRIGLEVSLAIKEIEALSISKNKHLIIERGMSFENINLDRSIADNQIMATFNYVLRNTEKYGGYQKYKLITEDINMRMISRCLFEDNTQAVIEAYFANTVEIKKNVDLPKFTAQKNGGLKLDYSEKLFGEVLENGGVLIDLKSSLEEDDKSLGTVLTMRKGEKLEILSSDLEIMGLKPYHKSKMNWNQLLAFHQLMDTGIQCLFLQGPAGTGKTLLAIAAALEQKHLFDELILVNPMVPLSNKNNLGFLPGDLKEKMSPWLTPFIQNLRFLEKKQAESMKNLLDSKNSKPLKQKNGNKPFEEDNGKDIWEKYGFDFKALDHIRGQTITNAFIIIEEAQNLTQHDIKTIITRAGEGTKIVFCADLSQIDIPYLTAEKSGLAYAIEKISGTGHNNKMVAVCHLTITVRSKLAAFASEMM